MSAISQTPGSVVFSAIGLQNMGPMLTAGATILKGQPCYYDATAGTVKLMGAAVTTIMASSTQFGLAAYGAASGQPVQLISKDPACVPGMTMAAGIPLQLHTTAGSFTQTQADLTSANVGASFGIPTSTTVLNLSVTMGAALA